MMIDAVFFSSAMDLKQPGYKPTPPTDPKEIDSVHKALAVLGIDDVDVAEVLAACSREFRGNLLRACLSATKCLAGDWHYVQFGICDVPKDKQVLLLPVIKEAISKGNTEIARAMLICLGSPDYGPGVADEARKMLEETR